MKKTMMAVAAGMALGTTVAWGAGYGIYEGSARGNSMGSEITADPVSPSVMYNNPAGITELPGTQVEAGVTFIKPSQTIVTDLPQGRAYTHGRSEWWKIPNAYVTHQFGEKLWGGMGLYTRAGLGSEFPFDWSGRYSNQKATITTLDLSPAVAWKVLDRLSLSAGLTMEYFDFELRRAIPTGQPFVDPDLHLKLTGNNYEIGYVLGAYWKATDWISFGASFERLVDQSVKGDYELTDGMGRKLGDGAAHGNFPIPGKVRAGTSIQATEKWKVNAGVVYTMWSSYDELTIHYDPALMGVRSSTTTPKNWHDAWRMQLGTEYALTDAWTVRAGYVHDKTPDPDYLIDYMVPANNRHLFSLGFGWHNEKVSVDVGYTFLLIDDRHVKGHLADGVWDGRFEDGEAHMVSLGLGYKF